MRLENSVLFLSSMIIVVSMGLSSHDVIGEDKLARLQTGRNGVYLG